MVSGTQTSIPPGVRMICLNPCFNGRLSRRQEKCGAMALISLRLNPCLNGIQSRTQTANFIEMLDTVLILVLMEYSLGQTNPLLTWFQIRNVLILVLMEYGLGPMVQVPFVWTTSCLNPCSNGIWSRTVVLTSVMYSLLSGLNPCFNGIWSLRRRA